MSLLVLLVIAIFGECIEISVTFFQPYMEITTIDPLRKYEVILECDNPTTLEVYDFTISSAPIIRKESVTTKFIGKGENTNMYIDTIDISVYNYDMFTIAVCNISVSHNNMPETYTNRMTWIIVAIIAIPVIVCCMAILIIIMIIGLMFCCCYGSTIICCRGLWECCGWCKKNTTVIVKNETTMTPQQLIHPPIICQPINHSPTVKYNQLINFNDETGVIM